MFQFLQSFYQGCTMGWRPKYPLKFVFCFKGFFLENIGIFKKIRGFSFFFRVFGKIFFKGRLTYGQNTPYNFWTWEFLGPHPQRSGTLCNLDFTFDWERVGCHQYRAWMAEENDSINPCRHLLVVQCSEWTPITIECIDVCMMSWRMPRR